MTKIRRKTVLLSAMLVVAGAVAASASSELWLHVRVEERGGASQVRVNLPLALFEKALPLIPEHHLGHGFGHRHGHGHGGFGDGDLTVAELRELWQEIRDSPDMTFVTVEEENEKVRVWKEAGYLRVHVDDAGGERVEARVPTAVVEALLSADELDWPAAVAVLAASGGGELVTVSDERAGDLVRVWIDETPEAD